MIWAILNLYISDDVANIIINLADTEVFRDETRHDMFCTGASQSFVDMFGYRDLSSILNRRASAVELREESPYRGTPRHLIEKNDLSEEEKYIREHVSIFEANSARILREGIPQIRDVLHGLQINSSESFTIPILYALRLHADGSPVIFSIIIMSSDVK